MVKFQTPVNVGPFSLGPKIPGFCWFTAASDTSCVILDNLFSLRVLVSSCNEEAELEY